MLNDKKNKQLVKSITPIINKLSSMWFPADKKSPDGYYYACPYCDMDCGAHVSHDADCFLQCAKIVKDKWVAIDEDDTPIFSPITKKKRTKEQEKRSKEFKKMRVILKDFFAPLIDNLTPFEYTPENEGVICDCNLDNPTKQEHNKKCFRQKLARIMSDYYNPDL